MLAVADPEVHVQWAEMDDETLLAQGRASGMNIGGVMVADGPAPDALKARLAQPHARFLDVGTGVGAICVALCQSWPLLHCVGLDIAERPLALGRREIAEAQLEGRVELRLLDVLDLSESNAFDVAWLPLPLLSGEIAEAALHAVVHALRPEGWILVAANSRSTDPLQAALTAFRAAAVGGGTAYQDDVRRWLTEAGITNVIEIPPRIGGSPLLAAWLPAA
jgi:ubiquinone/menaquinone biosynthesis C-methylase UbiE